MKFVYKPPSTYSSSVQSKCQVGSWKKKKGSRRKYHSKFKFLRKLWITAKHFTEQLKSCDWLHQPTEVCQIIFEYIYIDKVYRVQKCVVDWKIENVDFLISIFATPTSSSSCQKPAVMSICTETFTLGKEINQESTWYLNFRSHYKEDDDGSSSSGSGNHVSVLLFLKDYTGRMVWKPITVSFLIHVVDVNEEIVLTKHLEDVEFKVKSRGSQRGSNRDQHEDHDHGHGFFDLLSHSDLINPINNLISPQNSSTIHFRFEIYLTSQKPFFSRFDTIKNLVVTHSYENCLKIIKTETDILQPTGESVEIVAHTRSFHVHPKYFQGFSKLQKLWETERNVNGSLSLLHMDEFTDHAVMILLTYIIGNYTKFHQDFEHVANILKIAHSFNISTLLHDTWVNALVILNLDTLPRLTVLAFQYRAPNFVFNYIYMLILNYMWELKHLKSLHYWAAKFPQAFSAIFLETSSYQFDEDDEQVENEITQQIKNDFYSLEHLKMGVLGGHDHNFNIKIPILDNLHAQGDEQKIQNDNKSNSIFDLDSDCSSIDDQVSHEENCNCQECQRIKIFCRERLSIDYLAKVTSWNCATIK